MFKNEKKVYISKNPDPDMEENFNYVWLQCNFEDFHKYLSTAFRMAPDIIIIDNKSYE